MTDADVRAPAPTGRMLAVALGVAALWVAWGLVRHPGFQPVSWLRLAAPVLALLAGGGFMRQVAVARAQADARREIDRGGRALFMGFVMVTATFLAWLLVSQSIPSTWTALAGVPRTEGGVVSRRVAETNDADCRYRLVVASATGGGGAIALEHPQDECVDESVWRSATERGPVTLQLVQSALGADLVGVSAAR